MESNGLRLGFTGCRMRFIRASAGVRPAAAPETAKKYHGVPFDKVISVAEANAFKPHVATYTKAADIMGVPMDEVLFVANHAFDCMGAIRNFRIG